MMKHSYLFIAAMTAVSLAGILPANAGSWAASVRATHPHQAIILKAGERLFFPPPDPPGIVRPK